MPPRFGWDLRNTRVANPPLCGRPIWLLLVLWGTFCANAAAQARIGALAERQGTGLRRFEVGAEFADIRTDCISGNVQQCGLPQFGLGAGVSYNLTAHFAIDADLRATPNASQTATNQYGGRHTEYLVGLRTETRALHYGYFLKTQAGWLTWNHAITGVVFPSQGTFHFLFGDNRHFAGNLAAGVEYSPSPRIRFRGDIGDLLVAYSPTAWSNNLQSVAGVYFGLGKPIAWAAAKYDGKAAHRFFDPLNDLLLSAAVLGMTADSITTQRFIARGQVESDPFARPLVKYGWSGQVAAEGVEINALIWGMYGLHRIHQHWLERIAPGGVATAHAFLAYANDRITANPNSGASALRRHGRGLRDR